MLHFYMARVGSAVLSSIRMLLLAKSLGPAQYGVLGTIIIAQQLLSVFLSIGIRDGALVLSSKDSSRAIEILNSSIFAVFVVGICGMFFSGAFAEIYLNLSINENIAFSLIVFLSIFNDIFLNHCRCQRKFNVIAVVDLTYTSIPLLYVLIYWKNPSVSGVMLSILVGLSFSIVWYCIEIYKSDAIGKRGDSALIRKIIETGIPLSLNNVVLMGLASIFLIAANLRGESQVLIGKIALAQNFSQIAFLLPNIFSWLLYSKAIGRATGGINHLDANAARSQASRKIAIQVVGIFLYSLLVYMILSVFFPEYDGVGYFCILICIIRSYQLLNFSDVAYLIGVGQRWEVFLSNSLLLASMIVVAISVKYYDAFLYYAVFIGLTFALLFLFLALKSESRFGKVSRSNAIERVALLIFPIFLFSVVYFKLS